MLTVNMLVLDLHGQVEGAEQASASYAVHNDQSREACHTPGGKEPNPRNRTVVGPTNVVPIALLPCIGLNHRDELRRSYLARKAARIRTGLRSMVSEI